MTVEAIRSGIDLSHVDAGARPQDDLFGHVNGRWLADYAIPADRATDGAFRLLADRAEEQVRDIITEAAAANGAQGTDPQRIGDLYASFMDTDAIATPRRPPAARRARRRRRRADADRAGRRTRRAAAHRHRGRHRPVRRHRLEELLPLSAAPEQSGLGLPDESYYRDPQHAAILAEYPKHIARMFALVYGEHEGDWDATAAHIVALETKIAAAHWDVVKRRDADLTYNLRTFDELCSEATVSTGRCGCTRWASPASRPPRSSSANPTRWPRSPRCGTARTSRTGGAGCAGGVISGRASLLTDDLVDENFAFYGRTLSGTEQLRDRVEARRRAGREPDGRRRRPALRRAALPAGRQGADGRAGGQPASRPTGSASPTWSG